MIYNEKFVWLHFPKCAGVKIENMFQKYFQDTEGLHIDTVDTEKDVFMSWHDSISGREAKDSNFVLGDRDVIIPIRRLSSWLVSRFCFEVQRNPTLLHDKENLLKGKFLEIDGYESSVDDYMKEFLPEYILKNNRVRFLRIEFFESDFKNIFSDYLDLTNIPEEVYRDKLNVSQRCLSNEFIERLKNTDFNNIAPYWTYIEKLAYDSEVV